MPAVSTVRSVTNAFDRLRTELADLAYDLERQGRLDAADVVMQLEARVRELAGEQPASRRPESSDFHHQPSRGNG